MKEGKKAVKKGEKMEALANLKAENYAEKSQTLEEIAEELIAEARMASALASKQFAESINVEANKRKYLYAQMSLFDMGEEV